MDKKLLDALNNLSLALGEIAEALKNKGDDGDKSATTTALQSGKLDKQLQSIDEGVKQLLTDNKKILKNQETIIALSKNKPAEKKGPLDGATDPKQGSKLKDGLASIMMIAVGVLAIGMAFKLVGGINFLSVLALAIALPLVAIAFEKIAQMKDLKAGEMANIILVTVAIATAITLSSFILSGVRPVGIFKLITAVFIAAMFGAVAFGIGGLLVGLKEAKIDPMDTGTLIMLPIVMVAISLAIALSSGVLQLVKPVGIFKLITAVFIAAMFGAVAFGIGSLLVGLKEAKIDPMDTGTLVMLPLILVAISLAIALSSEVLQLVKPIGLYQFFTAVMIAIIFIPISFALPFIAKAMKDVDIKRIVLLPIMMVAMAAAIWLSSLILSKVEEIPFGLLFNIMFQAITLAVVGVTLGLTMMLLSKIGPSVILQGALSLVIIAGAIMVTSLILSLGSYDNYPSFGWAAGVGLSLVGFGLAATVLGLVAMSGVGALAIAAGCGMILLVAATVVATAEIVGTGNYGNYPPVSWSASLAISLGAFGLGALAIGTVIVATLGVGALALSAGLEAILMISQTIVDSSAILSKGNFTGGPTIQWAGGIALALGAFAPVYGMLMANSILSIFGGGGVGPEEFGNAINTIADGIVSAANKFNGTSFLGGPKKEWSEGVGEAIGAFSPVYGMLMANSILSIFGGGGVGPEEFGNAINTISDGIISAATKFNGTSFVGGPKKEWSEGVGGAIGAFAPVYKVLAENSGWFKSGISAEDMKNAIMTISQGIVDAANFFGSNSAAFDISKAPSKEWADGVGGSIKAFTPALEFISKNTGIFSNGTELITSALSATTMGIVMAANNLSLGNFDKQIPSEWMKNVSDNVKTYVDLAKYIVDADAENFDIGDISDGMVELANGYSLLADGVTKLNTQLEQIDIEKLTALKNLTGSIVLLSLMDSDQFESMMDALEDKAQIFVDVMNDLDKSGPEKVKGGTKGAPAVQVKSTSTQSGPKTRTMNDLYAIMQQVDQKLGNIAKSNDNMSKYVDEIRSSDIDLKKKK